MWAANQYLKSASGSRLTWENCSLFDPLVFFIPIQLLGKRSRAAAQSNHENTSLGWSLGSINPLLCEYKKLKFFYISLHFNTKSVCIQIIQKISQDLLDQCRAEPWNASPDLTLYCSCSTEQWQQEFKRNHTVSNTCVSCCIVIVSSPVVYSVLPVSVFLPFAPTI